MSFSNVVSTLPGITAATDLTANQFRGVAVDSSGRAALVTASTAAIDGILQNDPDVDQPATIWGPGSVSKAIVGTGGATRGSLATPVADGFTDASTGNIVSGRFLETGVAGTTVAMWLANMGSTAP